MLYDDTIPGWMTNNDLDAVSKLANLVPANGTLVEVGSLFGRSTTAWAMSCDPSVSIYCSDIFYEHYVDNHNLDTPGAPVSGKVYNAWEEFQKNTSKFKNVMPIRGRVPQQVKYDKGPIDVLFVDASHKNPSDWNIIEHLLPYVKVGGYIAGHDYLDDFPDVKDNAQKLSAMYNSPVNTFLNTGSTIWYIQVTKQL
jgi:predicted O-methyltransferase YrrM